MRRLNSLAPSGSNFWRIHQEKAISKLVNSTGRVGGTGVPKIEPLYPGSYLCNQLVVVEPDADGLGNLEIACEVSLDAIYESLSCATHSQYESYILIDGDHCDDVTGPMLFDAVCRNLDGVTKLLVLDHNRVQEMQRLFIDMPLIVEATKPKWHDAANVISLYRNASHCVFINSVRAVDAQACGCALTLISTPEFVKNLSTDALWRYLERCTNCYLAGAISSASSTEALGGVSSGKSVVAIMDNSKAEVHQVLEASVTNYSDWLDEYRETPEYSGPVIGPSPSVWYKPSRALLDLRLSFWRKSLKFIEDPKRFFSDSRNPVLKRFEKLIPTREAA